MIPVEEPYENRQSAGEIVMNALVGPHLEVFEIRLLGDVYSYWVNNISVPPDVYRDSMNTALVDRFNPEEHQDQLVVSGNTEAS